MLGGHSSQYLGASVDLLVIILPVLALPSVVWTHCQIATLPIWFETALALF